MLENIKSAKLISVINVNSYEGEHYRYGHNLKCYELVYKISGECITKLNKKVVTNKPNSIELLPKGDNKCYQVDIKKSGECIDIFFDTDAKIPFEIVVQEFSKDEKLKSLFEKINIIWNSKADGWYYKSMSVFYDILYYISSNSQMYISNKVSKKIEIGVNYLKEHYCDCNIDYFQPAKISGISYSYFKRIFTSVFGVTPVKYVRNLKMQRAKELLKTNHYSITEVAKLCGFDDLYFFSKCFKAHYGVSPKNYMKN